MSILRRAVLGNIADHHSPEKPFTLSVAITDGVHQGYIYARCTAEDMALTEEQFTERFLLPAFRQAKRELDYCYPIPDGEQKQRS